MANNFQTISSGLALLKNYYQGPVISQFNDDTVLYRGAEMMKEKWSGLQVVKPLKVRRNQGIGATSDGGTLPAVGRQTTVQAIIPAKFNYLRFGVTGPMLKSASSDVGSFVRIAAYEMQEGYKDLQSDVNRQLSWNGNGTLATVNTTAVGSTSLVIAGRESSEPALKFIDVDLVFDIYTSAGVLVQSGVTVSAISSGTATSSTATLTVAPAVTCSATDVLVRANSYGQEIQGILTQLDGATTTVFGIDRSLYPQAQGNVTDYAGGQLNLDVLQQVYNEGLRRGGKRYACHYVDFGTLRMYQKLLTADKRYVNTIKGDGGFASEKQNYMEFNGVPIIPDKDVPQRWFFVAEGALEKAVLAEMEFADETGTPYIASVSNDQLEARVRFFANLFNQNAAACGALTNYISP